MECLLVVCRSSRDIAMAFRNTLRGTPHVTTAPCSQDHWAIYRNIVHTREVLGLSSQVLTTLRGLMSFLKAGKGTVVYASNRTLAERADGLSERSIRRHLAQLEAIGLIQKQLSSNGKRYCVANPDGMDDAYGINLSPLLAQQERLSQLSDELYQNKQREKLFRKRLSTLIYKAGEHGLSEVVLGEYRRVLRRKLTAAQFSDFCLTLEAEIQKSSQVVETIPTIVLTVKDSQNGRQIDNINKNKYVYEPAIEKQKCTLGTESEHRMLGKVLTEYADALPWAEEPLNDWHSLSAYALQLAKWSGLSQALVDSGVEKLGLKPVVLMILDIVQRGAKIRNPGAYFRKLISPFTNYRPKISCPSS